MIALIIVVLLLLSAMSDWAEAEDWEASERNAEIRHRELMEAYEKKSVQRSNTVRKVSRKRSVKDTNGYTISEEVEIEGDFNYD